MSPLLRVILFSSMLTIICVGQEPAPVRISSEEAEKLLVEKSEPVYPSIAKAGGAKGIVKVETTVSELGVVSSAKAISGHPLLQSAAVNAVKKQKYKAHLVGDKPVPFITDVYVQFPSGTLTGVQKQTHERESELARQYYEEDDKCRNLVRAKQWKAAEESCIKIVRVADQFSEDRALERMGAYELFGHALRGQKRYREALDYFDRAREVVRSKLTEKDAELGALYGNIAITYHLMRDLDKARQLYQQAEKIYQLAHASIGDGNTDEWVEQTRRRYRKSLKTLLEYHLLAAEDAGATSEAEEVKKLIKSLQ